MSQFFARHIIKKTSQKKKTMALLWISTNHSVLDQFINNQFSNFIKKKKTSITPGPLCCFKFSIALKHLLRQFMLKQSLDKGSFEHLASATENCLYNSQVDTSQVKNEGGIKEILYNRYVGKKQQREERIIQSHREGGEAKHT